MKEVKGDATKPDGDADDDEENKDDSAMDGQDNPKKRGRKRVFNEKSVKTKRRGRPMTDYETYIKES